MFVFFTAFFFLYNLNILIQGCYLTRRIESHTKEVIATIQEVGENIPNTQQNAKVMGGLNKIMKISGWLTTISLVENIYILFSVWADPYRIPGLIYTLIYVSSVILSYHNSKKRIKKLKLYEPKAEQDELTGEDLVDSVKVVASKDLNKGIVNWLYRLAFVIYLGYHLYIILFL